MTFAKLWGYAVPFAKMLLILVIGHIIIVYIQKLFRHSLDKSKLDPSLIRFTDKAINIILHLLLVISALTTIGVSTTGLVAAFSAVAVGVSVALKDSLSNVAGGILLLISPRFSTGDYISVSGDEGTVIGVDLLHTTILTIDNKQVSIPNGILINSHIINYSRENNRRVDLLFPISYEADINKAKQLAIDTIENHPLTLREPEEPFARVKSYGDSAVNLLTRAWCKTENYWDVYYDLTENIREAFEENGISIPFNQLDVHIKEKFGKR